MNLPGLRPGTKARVADTKKTNQTWRFPLKLRYLLSFAALLASVPMAGAEEISSFSATLTISSSTEVGRLSRNGVQQDWLGAEAYPGFINTTTTYDYTIYTFSAALFAGAPYVEISDFDTGNGSSDFLSAYAGAYNPASPATGWLGDEGASGNYFGTDARYFDVILPVGDNLVLVLNNTTPGAGLNDPQNIDVSAYADTGYDDPPPPTVTPEPSTFITLGTGLIGIAGVVRRKLKK